MRRGVAALPGPDPAPVGRVRQGGAMAALVLLLRAVNLGRRQAPSARIRAVAEQLGHTQVVSHLASGNLVLVPAPGPGGAAREPSEVAAELSRALEADLGFDVPVVVRTRPEWDAIVAACPFPQQAADDPAHLLVTCWDGVPDVPGILAFDASAFGPELVVWHGREAYVWYPQGSGRSKLTPDVLARAAGRVGTSRNWNTLLALQRLAHERDG